MYCFCLEQKHAELNHLLCTKETLDDKDFVRLRELAKDSQVDINYKSKEEGHSGRTPLMLLCSKETKKQWNASSSGSSAAELIASTSNDESTAADQGSNNSHNSRLFMCVEILCVLLCSKENRALKAQSSARAL